MKCIWLSYNKKKFRKYILIVKAELFKKNTLYGKENQVIEKSKNDTNE